MKSSGITVVLCPLIALMNDQKRRKSFMQLATPEKCRRFYHTHPTGMNAHGLNAVSWHSELSPKTEALLMKDLASDVPRTRILLCSPERALSGRGSSVLAALHKSGQLQRVIVDEAHCIVEWGHDFRPQYARLVSLRSLLPGVQFVAMTATATPTVLKSIQDKLGMVQASSGGAADEFNDCFAARVVRASVDRPELRYCVAYGNTHFSDDESQVNVLVKRLKRSLGIPESQVLGDSAGDVATRLGGRKRLRETATVAAFAESLTAAASPAASSSSFSAFTKLGRPAGTSAHDVSSSNGRGAFVSARALAAQPATQVPAKKQQQPPLVLPGGQSRITAMFAAAAQTSPLKGRAIVYCSSIERTKTLSTTLNNAGVSALPYNAKMTPKQRSSVERQWRGGLVCTIVATIAFGMGIDCADVRMVVHWNLPKSLAAYYQEAGRAGRDGNEAECLLFVDMDEVHRAKYVVNQSIQQAEGTADSSTISDGGQNTQRSQQLKESSSRLQKEFNAMVKYCTTAVCRRHQIASHFGEKASGHSHPSCKGSTGVKCDVCSSGDRISSYVQMMVAPVSTFVQPGSSLFGHTESILDSPKRALPPAPASSSSSLVARMRARLNAGKRAPMHQLRTGAVSEHGGGDTRESRPPSDRRNGTWWEGSTGRRPSLGIRRRKF